MKKKTLFNISVIALAVTAAIQFGASAMDVARQKELCDKSKTKVWIESDKACIPENPCKKDKYAKYCNKTFSGIDLFEYDDPTAQNSNVAKQSNIDEVVEILNNYVIELFGGHLKYGTCTSDELRFPKNPNDRYDGVGANFVGCRFAGKYIAFQLGTSPIVDDKKAAGYCLTYGGTNVSQAFTTNNAVYTLCEGISKTHCESIGGEYRTESNGYDVKWCLIPNTKMTQALQELNR